MPISQDPRLFRDLPLRMQQVQTPIIPTVAQLIRDHPGTLSLGQGVVSYGPPPEAFAALQKGMSDQENHKYRPVAGIPELTEALWRKLENENGIPRSQDLALLVTAGSNLGFMNAILAITDPGCEIILPTPYYFNHEMAITMASCKPVLVSTDEHYQLKLDALRDAITPQTRAIVTVSPNNPTGAVYPRRDLEAVNALCLERGIYHIHDEAYEYFTYDGAEAFSPGSIPGGQGHTISLFSLSKGYGFASWRIGFMLVPQALMDPLMKIQDTLLICAPVVSQYAALGAVSLGRAWANAHFDALRRSRDSVRRGLEGLKGLCTLPPADGAFYFYITLPKGPDPLNLVRKLVSQYKVAVVPGNAFGSDGCRLRISYGALSPDNAQAAIDRLAEGLRRLIGS